MNNNLRLLTAGARYDVLAISLDLAKRTSLGPDVYPGASNNFVLSAHQATCRSQALAPKPLPQCGHFVFSAVAKSYQKEFKKIETNIDVYKTRILTLLSIFFGVGCFGFGVIL